MDERERKRAIEREYQRVFNGGSAVPRWVVTLGVAAGAAVLAIVVSMALGASANEAGQIGGATAIGTWFVARH